jgi:hypothetical protein
VPRLQAETRGFPGVRSVRALLKQYAFAEALFVDVFESAEAGEAYFAWRRSTGALEQLHLAGRTASARLLAPRRRRMDRWWTTSNLKG